MRRLAPFLPCLIGAVLAASGESRAAVDRIVEAEGTVHRVTTESWPADQLWTSTAIRYTRQSADGHVSSMLIPGTDDYVLDRDPALAIDPQTGQPIIVWSRYETVGYDLYAVTIRNGSWSPPRLLLAPNPSRVRPRVKTDASLVHVFWTHQLDGNVSRVARASFLPGSLTLLLGPEPARVDCVPPPMSSTGASDGTTADGGSFNPVGGDPPSGDTYFAAEVPGGPGEPPVLGVWGVRDEPVPIDFRAAFSLPIGAQNLSRVDAAMISGRLTVWFEWSGGLWYAFDDGAGRFTPLRVIKREAGGFSADAIVLLRELLDRLPAPTP